MQRHVFITGATGYMGSRLVPLLTARGHKVTALVRPGSEKKLPAGCSAVSGNPLDRSTFLDSIAPADTFVQLVGTPHPSPAKAAEFRSIDLVSARESIIAAKKSGIEHFVYVSVAQPAPIMREYIAVRQEVEHLLRESGLSLSILRPWYVLGPGHWWPYAILPLYWLAMLAPGSRNTARRLYPVTLQAMLSTLVDAVERNATGIIDAEGIKGNAKR